MIIKWTGLVLSFSFFSLLGFYQSYKLSLRKRSVADVLVFLNRINTNIRYRTDDIFTLVDECAEGSLVPLKNNTDYQQAVEALPFHKDDKKLLKRFFANLGTTDIEGQLSHIELYTRLFDEQYRTAKSEIEKKSKLYKMSGLFSGLAFVVILV